MNKEQRKSFSMLNRLDSSLVQNSHHPRGGKGECLWEKATTTVLNKHNIVPPELQGTRFQTKNLIKRAIATNFNNRILLTAQGKSKIEYFLDSKSTWVPNKRVQYMSELTKKHTSMIFKARTRMLKFKGNCGAQMCPRSDMSGNGHNGTADTSEHECSDMSVCTDMSEGCCIPLQVLYRK